MSTTRDRMQQRARGLTTGTWFNARFKELEAAGKVQQFEIADGRRAAPD
jgi:hypothetical protein